MLNKKALAGTAGAPKEYVEDVFSTWLYTGNGSTGQTITNGIDLANKGGLIWFKDRSNAYDHVLLDTARVSGSSEYVLFSNTTAAQGFLHNYVTYNNNGFSISTTASGNLAGINDPSANQVSWTFREAKKFFDVVTYTGNGANRTIAHNLGSVPGMIIVKRTDLSGNWIVYHTTQSAGVFLELNTSSVAVASSTTWNNTEPTSTLFSLGTDVLVNANGGTYVAYLFAHDAGGFGDAGTDNIITCGSFVTTGSGEGTVTLGYEPQFIMAKSTGVPGNWRIQDTTRGWGFAGTDSLLLANTLDAESSSTGGGNPTSTGFLLSGLDPSEAYIYMAIRRPMKVPTSGSQVFSPTVYTGTNADNRLIDTGIFTDMVMLKERNDTVLGMVVGDRLRGQPYLLTGSTAVENADADSLMTPTSGYGNAFAAMNGVGVGNDATSKVNSDTASNNHIALAFKRARKFFDIVCYTGTGANRTVTHNLGVAPELMIVKRRDSTSNWTVFNQASGNTGYLNLNTNESLFTGNTDRWNSTSPTSSVFSLGTNTNVNASSGTYVAYLFASVDGISKVGSYSGNGSNQTINCGFSAGARLVLIKRTDSTGDWYVFDTARGIVSGNDPFMLLNSASAEVTTRDAIDPDNSGFIVNNDATNFPINVNNATYIYLAIA